MIKDRPAFLLDQAGYHVVPKPPLQVDFTAIPEPINRSLFHLGGVQPVTQAMVDAADGMLRDQPSPGEVSLFQARGTQFQMVSIVVSVATAPEIDGVATGIPYAVTLVPAQKRGAIQTQGIEWISTIDIATIRQRMEPAYTGFDPFAGDWSLYGPAAMMLQAAAVGRGFIDEVGLVADQYFLATDVGRDEALSIDGGFATERANYVFNRNRNKLLFKPFDKVHARQVWGVGSPIELFLYQAMLGVGLRPVPQVILFEDGSAHACLQDFWQATEEAAVPNRITEPDFYFPNERLAVFCDSGQFHRGAAKEKDRAIDQKLDAIGVRQVRLRGADIVSDLGGCLKAVLVAL